jgi:hypothetical protein
MHGDERLLRPRPERVNGARKLPLAGTAFARDEHGRARAGHLPASRYTCCITGLVPNSPWMPSPCCSRHLAPQVFVFDSHVSMLDGSLQREHERVEVHRLRQ